MVADARRALVFLDVFSLRWSDLHALPVVPFLTNIAADPELIAGIRPTTCATEGVAMLFVLIFLFGCLFFYFYFYFYFFHFLLFFLGRGRSHSRLLGSRLCLITEKETRHNVFKLRIQIYLSSNQV
jgi:hypothetical protein